MNKQTLYGAVGLARKAGKCICGDYAVERIVKSGKAKFVLLDESASTATKYRYESMCTKYGIDYLELAELGLAIGKPGNKIVAVTDNNFANMIKVALKE